MSEQSDRDTRWAVRAIGAMFVLMVAGYLWQLAGCVAAVSFLIIGWCVLGIAAAVRSHIREARAQLRRDLARSGFKYDGDYWILPHDMSPEEAFNYLTRMDKHRIYREL